MARPLRIEFDGALYHVTSRGNARELIFIIDTNRILFLDKKESALIARLKTLRLPLNIILIYLPNKIVSVPICL